MVFFTRTTCGNPPIPHLWCYLHLWPHHHTCQCRHTAIPLLAPLKVLHTVIATLPPGQEIARDCLPPAHHLIYLPAYLAPADTVKNVRNPNILCLGGRHSQYRITHATLLCQYYPFPPFLSKSKSNSNVLDVRPKTSPRYISDVLSLQRERGPFSRLRKRI